LPTKTVVPAISPDINEVLAAFRVVFGSIRTHNRIITRRCGVGALHIRALAVIRTQPGIGVSELARILMIHQPASSKLVDELASRRLVVRARHVADRRAMALRITSQGTKLLKHAPEPWIGVLPDALNRVNSERLRQMNQVLLDLLAIMRSRTDEARLVPLTDS
jgi:DNA-binding MarR family transcriptional regulator